LESGGDVEVIGGNDTAVHRGNHFGMLGGKKSGDPMAAAISRADFGPKRVSAVFDQKNAPVFGDASK
jgi:hypothetical protein